MIRSVRADGPHPRAAGRRELSAFLPARRWDSVTGDDGRQVEDAAARV